MTGDAPLAPDELRLLDRGLAGAAVALDREIVASGALDRVIGRVMVKATRHPGRRAAWFAIAAALIVAAGLGSLADFVFVDARTGGDQTVVVMDPLVFGPAVEQQ